MIFNSFTFLIFLGIFLACYFATRGSVRLSVCLAGSYTFYGWWDYRFLTLIIVSTLIDYFIALGLSVRRTRRCEDCKSRSVFAQIWASWVSLSTSIFLLSHFTTSLKHWASPEMSRR